MMIVSHYHLGVTRLPASLSSHCHWQRSPHIGVPLRVRRIFKIHSFQPLHRGEENVHRTEDKRQVPHDRGVSCLSGRKQIIDSSCVQAKKKKKKRKNSFMHWVFLKCFFFFFFQSHNFVLGVIIGFSKKHWSLVAIRKYKQNLDFGADQSEL